MQTKTTLLALVLAAGALLPGCRSLGTGAGTGAVVGTALGTGAGYAIGRHNGKTWEGAAIGALAGGVAGYLIGDQVEPATRERPLEGPAVYRTDSTPAPALPCSSTRVVTVREVPAPVVRERVIVRDVYPDGTVRERTVIVE